MQSLRYRLAVLSLLVSFISATQIARRTEDVDTSSYFEYGLSSFSIRFQKCQYVKSFDDDVAADEDEDSVLAMKHFVVFKLCPSDECDKCSGVHGHYVADIEDYLAATVEREQEDFQNMCDNCYEMCDDNGDSCTGCGKACYEWTNLEAQGYVDASNYIDCQKFNVQNDDDEDIVYYVGPRCSSDRASIQIGVFSDAYCFQPVDDVDVEDLIGAKLSYYVLSNVVATSSGESTCLSCKESNYNDNKDEEDEDEVNEMCEEVYNKAAKCETPYGLTNGFIDMNKQADNYENQVENEYEACTFIKSLVWNSYTEAGEINIFDDQDEVVRQLTNNQAIAMSCLGLAFVVIISYGLYLHKAIEKATAKVDLSEQGHGVMS